MRISKFITAVSLTVLSCSSDSKQTAPPKPPPTAVDVMVAQFTTLADRLECNGSVLASESVELRVESSGRLISIYQKDGVFVKAGTLLAKVNDAELQAQLRQQNILLELARKNKSRLEQLVALNGVNQSDYDEAVSKVATIEAAIDVIKAQIEKTEVRARFDGVLGLRTVSVGAYVTPQTLLGILQQKGQVKVDFTVPEQYRSYVKIGSRINIAGTGTSRDTLVGTVSATETQVNSSTRNLVCRVLLSYDGFLPGSFVKVLIPRATSCIAIPSQCIIPDAVSDKVLVVKEGKGSFANIRTGARTRGFVEVIDGLSEGDSVIVTGVLFVRPDSPVKIRSVKTFDTTTGLD
ncbi:MAG: efflux RND transporter periplasmic adaptor subunit [Bacteroidota bacterium]